MHQPALSISSIPAWYIQLLHEVFFSFQFNITSGTAQSSGAPFVAPSSAHRESGTSNTVPDNKALQLAEGYSLRYCSLASTKGTEKPHASKARRLSTALRETSPINAQTPLSKSGPSFSRALTPKAIHFPSCKEQCENAS